MFFGVKGVFHGIVEAASRQVAFHSTVEGTWARIFIQPETQFFQLFLRQVPDRSFDFFHSFTGHPNHPCSG